MNERRHNEMIEKSFKLIILGLLILGFSGCQSANISLYNEVPKVWKQVSREEIHSQNTIPVFTYKIIKTYPHDVTSYTEGLLMHDGYLFEGTGRYNQSSLLKIDIKTGMAIQRHKLGPRYFGEGITILQDHIFQLTYKSNIGFLYNKDSFSLKKIFHYPTQGWGLTTDGNELIMSDGSAALIFLDPKTLRQKKIYHGVRRQERSRFSQ